jgi:chromosomal replication initiator protein
MGKTHLLHAAACEASGRGWEVACLTGEQFTNAYVGALRRKEMEAFQAAVRGVRLLVIDDLQYFEGKPGTLDELVHCIDEVRHAGGVIGVGSERDPAKMALPDRLKSRLGEGVRARITPFTYAERMAFVGRRAAEMRVDLPRWAVERVAGIEAPCVRALQGFVKAATVLARSGRLEMGELDAALTYSAAQEMAPAASGERALIEAIAAHFETTFDELVGRSAGATLQKARAVVVAALHERGKSFSQIGAALDGRDRSSVHGLVKRGREALAEDGRLRERLAASG